MDAMDTPFILAGNDLLVSGNRCARQSLRPATRVNVPTHPTPFLVRSVRLGPHGGRVRNSCEPLINDLYTVDRPQRQAFN